MSDRLARARRHARPLVALVVVVCVSLLAACGQDAPKASRTPASRAWSEPDGDLSNTRQAHGSIDAASVGRLRKAWSVPLRGLYAATPVIVGGVAYTEDLQSNVYAIDLASGRVRWTRRYEQGDTGPNGVNVADGRVYGVLPHEAFALDAKTGRQLWSRELTSTERELIVMTPGEKDGTVYVSTVPGELGSTGTLYALDGATGRRLWAWDEVPRSLWGSPEVNGGGGLWHPPAFDAEGNLYVSVANPLPFPGTPEAPWGSSRPGPNRWDDSIVKLDASTGRFLWGTQVEPHDIYDWDLEAPVMLVTAAGRRLAITGGKMGFVYGFDAGSGRLLWKRSVGLHNGHDDDNLLAMRGRFERLRLGRLMYPGDWGGVETPMATDGSSVYVPVVNFPATYRTMQFGPPTQGDPITGTGELVALDLTTGRVEWDRKLPHSPYGAATVSNDLVFTTTYDGTLWALDTRTGKVVWSTGLTAGTDGPVAIAGDTLVTAASIPIKGRSQVEIDAYRLAR